LRSPGAGEPLPIHGADWLAPWGVEQSERERVRLVLERNDDEPYAYRAALTYALDGATLAVTLEIENTGREPLPFGLGIHPFLARLPARSFPRRQAACGSRAQTGCRCATCPRRPPGSSAWHIRCPTCS
jgi:galactose mutarotase-like enzyme